MAAGIAEQLFGSYRILLNPCLPRLDKLDVISQVWRDCLSSNSGQTSAPSTISFSLKLGFSPLPSIAKQTFPSDFLHFRKQKVLTNSFKFIKGHRSLQKTSRKSGSCPGIPSSWACLKKKFFLAVRFSHSVPYVFKGK